MKPYVLVLDHGTTGIRACLMSREGEIVAFGYQKVPQIYPQPGWVEHNPKDLWDLTLTVIEEAFSKKQCTWNDIHAVGMTNQRETTIVWDKTTGEPVHNAIVWQCRRTAPWCDDQKADPGLVKDIQTRTGLVLDAYFSASKVRWLFQQYPNLSNLVVENKLLFGTVDTWILWKLTGGKVHATDYTNASRTMLYNIQTKQWDPQLLEVFGVPESILPTVQGSASHYGVVDPQLTGGVEVPITGIIGDQQSALYGQRCWLPGTCKNTFGTGAFLMMNLGTVYHTSDAGLLTTLACDRDGNPVYAMEGAIFIAGAAMEWLKDTLGLISSFEAADQQAASLTGNDGVYFVPAFVGLGAPYWESEARGVITGLTQGTTPAHLARAALEAMAYQTADVVSLMQPFADAPITLLKVDGGVSRSNFLMQFLADILETPVARMQDAELTAKGAGYLAGLATNFWSSPDEIAALPEPADRFTPAMSKEDLKHYKAGWVTAIQTTLTPLQKKQPSLYA